MEVGSGARIHHRVDQLWDDTIHAWPVNGASWLLFNNGSPVFSRLTYNAQPPWHLFFFWYLCFSSLLLCIMMNQGQGQKNRMDRARHGDASHEMFLFYSFCIGSG